MTTTTVPGSRYHQLARTPTNSRTRTIVGTVLGAIGYIILVVVLFAGGTVAAVALGRPNGPDGYPALGPLAEFILALASIILFLPCVLLAARWMQGRRAGSLSSVVGRIRWRWPFGCALVAVPAVLLTVAGTVALYAVTGGDSGEDEWVGWSTFVPALLVVLALVPLQAAAEEYLCRGYLLQSVGAFVRGPWGAIVVQAVIFALIHGIGSPWGFADLCVFGVVTGWLAVQTGGLESGIALHAVNNLIIFGLTVGMVGGLTDESSAADSGWQLAVVDIVVVVGYALVIRWLARRFRIMTVSPAAPALDAPALDADAEPGLGGSAQHSASA